MPTAVRGDDGTWTLEEDQGEDHLSRWQPAFREALPRYLTALDPAFDRARARCEFQFLLTLFRIRGMQMVELDPYETTLRAIPALTRLHQKADDREAARHLELWIYGHIVEASEPYELLANLIDVSEGGAFKLDRFPPNDRGISPSPGEKIRQIEAAAASAGMPIVPVPLKEIWDRGLRNAIFHADYALTHDGVRIPAPIGSRRLYTHDEVDTLANRALAYHDALSTLFRSSIKSYTEPIVIPTDPRFSHGEPEPAQVMVREGYGAVGIQALCSPEERAGGKIHWRLGRFTLDEERLMSENSELALFPPLRPAEQRGDAGLRS